MRIVPQVLQGSIVRAQVTDPQGGNPKQRPLVVITATAEIDRDGKFVAVAITGEFATPVSDDEVLLQWHPLGRCRTRLRKPSVAKCSWLTVIPLPDVIEVRGHVPPSELEAILARVGKF